jgi:hypothetical protein
MQKLMLENPVVLSARAKAVKGMVELVRGNLELGISSPWFFFFFFLGHCSNFRKLLNA